VVTLDYNAVTLRANTADESLRKPSLPERIRGFAGAADKLGYWLSKLGLHQVASTLAVEF